METAKNWTILGAAFDRTSHTRGCAQAPAAIRAAELEPRLWYLSRFGITAEDGGDISLSDDDTPTESTDRPRFLTELLDFSALLIPRLLELYRLGRTPFVIGGDHAISIASVSAASAYLREIHGPNARLGLVWVDAHPDLEIPSTGGSGNIHGMAAAHLLGLGNEQLSTRGGPAPQVQFADMVYIGLRDASPRERARIRENGITAYTMTEVEEFGIVRLCRDVFLRMAEQTDGFVVSFDIDACDPREIPGVQAPERGGLRFREARACMELASRAEKLLSLELVEVNPPLDASGETVKAALALIEAGLGARPA